MPKFVDEYAGAEQPDNDTGPQSVSLVKSRHPKGQKLRVKKAQQFSELLYPLELHPPVFIHSSFRTSSTWLWSKFRRLPNVLAYYEIFNEALQDLNTKTVNSSNNANWESHHPSQAAYFLEFIPLLKSSGGVTGFDPTMSFDGFIPDGGFDGDISIQEKFYINLLVEQAYNGHMIPVLSCTRSIGRMAALKRCMPIKNVLVYRNLFHQWASYSGQFLREEPYFFYTIERTIKSCHKDHFLSRLDDFFSKRTSTPDDEQTFAVFLLMHIYFYAQAIDSSDVIVDVTSLAKDCELRNSVETELSRLVLSPVDLSDIRPNFDLSLLCIKNLPSFTDTIDQFVKMILASCKTERSANFVNRLKEDTLAELDRHNALTRHSMAWHEKQTEKLRNLFDQQERDLASSEALAQSLVQERDGIAASLAETRAAREAAEALAQSLVQDRDGIAASLAETRAAREAAEALAQSLVQERDGIAASLAETRAARKAAEALAQSLVQDRDGIAASLAETRAAREAAEALAQSLVQDRDDLAAVLAETRTALEEAEALAQHILQDVLS